MPHTKYGTNTTEYKRITEMRALISHTLSDDGWTFVMIGELFGISPNQARKLAMRGELQRKLDERALAKRVLLLDNPGKKVFEFG